MFQVHSQVELRAFPNFVLGTEMNRGIEQTDHLSAHLDRLRDINISRQCTRQCFSNAGFACAWRAVKKDGAPLTKRGPQLMKHSFTDNHVPQRLTYPLAVHFDLADALTRQGTRIFL